MEYKLNDKEKSYLKKLIINERIDYIRKSRIFDREVLVDFSDFILKLCINSNKPKDTNAIVLPTSRP